MRLVLQRVSHASVDVAGERIATIGHGLLVLVGIAQEDDDRVARDLATKTTQLRIFGDADGHFNLSLLDVAGEALVVSQFTLHADARRGRRPSFIAAARPEHAAPLVETYATALQALGVRVARGRFGADMQVSLTNDGPVTIILDSEELAKPRRS